MLHGLDITSPPPSPLSMPPTDPVILLTGASRGLGLAITQHLLNHSTANLHLVSRSTISPHHRHPRRPHHPSAASTAVTECLAHRGRTDALIPTTAPSRPSLGSPTSPFPPGVRHSIRISSRPWDLVLAPLSARNARRAGGSDLLWRGGGRVSRVGSVWRRKGGHQPSGAHAGTEELGVTTV